MEKHKFVVGAVAGALLAAAFFSAAANAQDHVPGTIQADGTVIVPSFSLPPSIYMSEEARKALPRTPTDMEEGMRRSMAAGKAGEFRKRLPELTAPRIKHLADLYPVTMRTTTVAGVPAVIATPVKAIPNGNRRKIILNLPGGGFVMAEAGSLGMTESIPLAALAQVEVMSITYRQAPEASFPAASEDVAAVYRELLKTHRPQDIAIYGCSAGGLLTAQSMAWFMKEKLPLPGAIGILCSSADARLVGDSRAWAYPLQGLPPLAPHPQDYFSEQDLTNPLASPILSPELLRRFPPTLVITATRAKELSAAVSTHRELVKAGVDAELHVWDGLGHAFFYNIDQPESREAFDVMARFFRKHLRLQ